MRGGVGRGRRQSPGEERSGWGQRREQGGPAGRRGEEELQTSAAVAPVLGDPDPRSSISRVLFQRQGWEPVPAIESVGLPPCSHCLGWPLPGCLLGLALSQVLSWVPPHPSPEHSRGRPQHGPLLQTRTRAAQSPEQVTRPKGRRATRGKRGFWGINNDCPCPGWA